MREQAGPELDREMADLLFGEATARVLPFSTDNASADLLLWRLSQSGVAFKVQQFEGVHYCMLWNGSEAPRQRLATGSARSRPLAICFAVLRLFASSPPRTPAKLPGPPSRFLPRA